MNPILPTPAEMIAHLNRFVRGQTRAKQDMAVAVYNHYLSQACRAREGADLGQHHLALSRQDLREIITAGIERSPLAKQQRLAALHGLELTIEDDALETLKTEHLDWPGTTGSARQWSETFQTENQHRPALIFRLAEELRNRQATIAEFFLAYAYSNTDNIQANLHYLDYQRLKAAGEKSGAK